MFCNQCGSLMFPKNGSFVCCKCNSEKKISAEKVVITSRKDKEVAVIDSNSPTLPKTNVTCPKCAHNEAFWVLRQTRAADEPETRIYRCTKCSHSWREY